VAGGFGSGFLKATSPNFLPKSGLGKKGVMSSFTFAGSSSSNISSGAGTIFGAAGGSKPLLWGAGAPAAAPSPFGHAKAPAPPADDAGEEEGEEEEE
jgi:hypothetical protein